MVTTEGKAGNGGCVQGAATDIWDFSLLFLNNAILAPVILGEQ
jgi:hypothetical protein